MNTSNTEVNHYAEKFLSFIKHTELILQTFIRVQVINYFLT